MLGIFVVAIVATPFVFAGWIIDRVLKHRAHIRQLEAQRHPPALPPAHDPEVEQRLRTLEAIVTSLDYDLAERLRAEQTRAA